MLSRPGPLPSGSGWSFELKWDGFRAIVSTEGAAPQGEARQWRDRRPVAPLIVTRLLRFLPGKLL
jgi:ATP-dependent DNA ligase